jgi:hypothetical protein
MSIFSSVSLARFSAVAWCVLSPKLLFALAIAVLLAGSGCSSGLRAQETLAPPSAGATAPAAVAAGKSGIHHYEYVFPDGACSCMTWTPAKVAFGMSSTPVMGT